MTAVAEPSTASGALAPENLAAVAALSSLRAAYPYVAEVTAAEAYGYGVRNRRPTREFSDAARARQDELLRAERDGRNQSARAGIKLSATGRAPARAELLDAQVHAQTTVVDQCWIISSTLAARTSMLAWGPPYLAGDDPWSVATGYLAVTIRLTSAGLAVRVARELDYADADIRRLVGLNTVRIPLPGDRQCPACGRNALKVDITSAEDRDWTIACRADCLCTGTQCACGRPFRQPGQHHLWAASHFATRWGNLRTLRRLAEAQTRARRTP